MSIEPLVNALDSMREQYAQRQKLSNNLQNALKGSTSALGKAERALRSYAEQNGATNNTSVIDQARRTITGTRLKDDAIDPLMPDLRREAKLYTNLTAGLKDAATALRGESIDVVKLGRALQALQGVKIQDRTLAEILPQLEEELDRAQQQLSTTFGLPLRHAFEAQGIELGGRPPRFEIGRFEIDTNFSTRSAAILYGKEVVVKRVPLSTEAIVKAFQKAQKSILDRNEDPARWIEQLHTAWEYVRRKRAISEPRANIIECYIELLMIRQPRAFRLGPAKNTLAEYSRAQFAYDFAEFTSGRAPEFRGLRAFGLSATKSTADNPERSIWIVNGIAPHDGQYIADLKFDRDE